MPAALAPTLDFLAGLKAHNDRAWFEAHRAEYDAARAAHSAFIDSLIDELRDEWDLGPLQAKACMTRIHRDVRFSKDKSPYKTNFAALIAPGGWKSGAYGFYVSVEAGGQSMAGGGLYAPMPAELQRYRTAIDHNAKGFERVVGAAEFRKTFGEVQGDRLKTAPKGYDREHPALARLQLKQVIALRNFTDAQVLSPRFKAQLIATGRALQPFLHWLDAQVRD